MNLDGQFTDVASEVELLCSAVYGDPEDVRPHALAAVGSLDRWTDPRHGVIAGAILVVYDRTGAVSVPWVISEILAAHGAEGQEIVDYLVVSVLRDSLGRPAYAYADPAKIGRDLQDLSTARNLLEAIHALLARADGAGRSAKRAREWVGDLAGILEAATTGRVSEDVEPLASDSSGTELTAERPTAFRTGIPRFDRRVRIMDGELVVLAGVPGSGKSTLALQTAMRAAEQGRRVLYVSVEMARPTLFRWAAAGMDDRAAGDGPVSTEAAADIASRILLLPLRVIDAPGLTLAAMRARIAATFHGPEPPGLIVVDHVQRVAGERGRNDREEREIASVVRALSSIARSRRVVVLALSQLNRAGYHGRPGMENLRETGVLEQDADKVLMLWRPDPNTVDRRRLSVVKNRHGESGTEIELVLLGARHRLEESVEEPGTDVAVGRGRPKRRERWEP